VPIQGGNESATTLESLAQALANAASSKGWSVSEASVLNQLRVLQQTMIGKGWTEDSSFNFLVTLHLNEQGQLMYQPPGDKPPVVFTPGKTTGPTGPQSDGPWVPSDPADSPTTTTASITPLSAYVNAIYQSGLFPTADLMALANQAQDNQWDMSRFQNALFKSDEYHAATAPTFEQYIFNAGLSMTSSLQALVDRAVSENWSTARFQDELRQSGEYQDRAAISYDAILGQYGLDPGKYADLINQAVTGNYTEAEFMYFLRQTPEFHQRMSVQYKQYLSQFGLSGDNLSTLIDEAVNKNYSSEEFLYYLRQTPEYRQRFAGIYDPKTGQLRMDEASYINLENSLKQLGKQYGYGVSHHDVAVAINKGITPDLYEQRLKALQRLHEYQPSMASFRATLAARGLVDGNKDFTRAEMENFVTGMANPKWYQVWQETQGRTAAFVAGLTVGGGKDQYTSIARSDIMRVLKTLPGEQTEAELQQYFNRIAQQFATVLPMDEAKMFGVNKQTIEKATIGGKGAQQAAIKVERAQGTQQAFTTGQRATSAYGAEDKGPARAQTQ